VTDPYGGGPGTSPGPMGRPPGAPPSRPSSDRPALWKTVRLPVTALAALVAVVVAAHLADTRRSAETLPGGAPSTGSAAPSSALEGEWSGEATLTDCAGFADDGCPAARSVTLTIDCSGQPCVVTPFDRRYGRPPLRFEDGGYGAAGPVPKQVAPTCDGTPTSSAVWRLDLTVQDGRLLGSYAESTIQGFDCGATWLRWLITFDRV
jgi:hypothetical protein